MQEAIDAVKSSRSKSIYAAAEDFDVSYSTLKHRVNGCVSQQENHEHSFPYRNWKLVQWITPLTITGNSPSHKMVREMAELLRE